VSPKLIGDDTPLGPPPVFRTNAVDTGKSSFSNVDNIAEVLAVVEGEDYR
jgi:hypothetical protein